MGLVIIASDWDLILQVQDKKVLTVEPTLGDLILLENLKNAGADQIEKDLRGLLKKLIPDWDEEIDKWSLSDLSAAAAAIAAYTSAYSKKKRDAAATSAAAVLAKPPSGT